MNVVDVINIQDELNKRKAASYEFVKGGDISHEDILNSTSEELSKLLLDFKTAKESQAKELSKSIVDEIFKKYGEEDDNMIIISAAYCPERDTCDIEDPLYWIDFNDPINKRYFPVGRKWEFGEYEKSLTEEEQNRWDEYYSDASKLEKELYEIDDICPADQLWEEDNHQLNEYWIGVVGVTRDYRVISFVIRDDGIYATHSESTICQL